MKTSLDTNLLVSFEKSAMGEPEWSAFDAAAAWLREHPNTRILDVTWSREESDFSLNVYYYEMHVFPTHEKV